MSFLIPNRSAVQRRASANFSAGFTLAAVGNAVPPGRAGATITMASDFAPKGKARIESGATISTTLTLAPGGKSTTSGGSTVTETWGENTTDTHKSVTADTRLNETTPTTNYGTNDSLFIEGSIVGDLGESSIIRYDISALLSGAQITSGKLRFTYRRAAPPAVQALVHVFRGLRNDFVVAEANWNAYKTGSSWSIPGAKGANLDVSGDPAAQTGMLGTITIPAGTTQNTVFELSITAEVQARFAAGQPINIALQPDPANGEHVVFGSSRAGDGFRPILEITGSNLSNGSSGGGGDPTGPGATGQYWVWPVNGKTYDPQGNLFKLVGATWLTGQGTNIPDSITKMGDPGWRFTGLRYTNLNDPTTLSAAAQADINQFLLAEKVVYVDTAHEVGGIATASGAGIRNLTTLKNYVRSIAQVYGSNPRVWYSVYNEPGDTATNADASIVSGHIVWNGTKVQQMKDMIWGAVNEIRAFSKAPIVVPSLILSQDIARVTGGQAIAFTDYPVEERSFIIAHGQEILDGCPNVVGSNGAISKNIIFSVHLYGNYKDANWRTYLDEFLDACDARGFSVIFEEFGLGLNNNDTRESTRSMHAMRYVTNPHFFHQLNWVWNGDDPNNMTTTDTGCDVPATSSFNVLPKCGTCNYAASTTKQCGGPDLNSLTTPTNLSTPGKAAWDATHPGTFLPGSF